MLGRIISSSASSTSSAQDDTVLVARGRHVAGAPCLRALTPSHDVLSDTGRTVGRAAERAERAARRRSTRRRQLQLISLAVALATAIGLGAVAAGSSRADEPHSRGSFAPTAVGATASVWRNDLTLGRTGRADQYAQAMVTGLQDGRYSAGFRLRYANRRSQVLAAVSGTDWLIQPSDGPAVSGTFAHASSGLFRAEIEGRTVRIRWNGRVVAARSISGTYAGRHIVGTVRQPTTGVRMRSIVGASLADPRRVTGTNPLPVGTAGSWLSGAAGPEAAAGTFGAWRGSAVRIGGTWTDTYDAQTDQWMICGGPWKNWNAPLDLAVGAIFRDQGETWAAAARGAYTARWTQALKKIKSCWGTRDPKLLYLRFAHEMNLGSSPWAVRKGEEANFVKAMTLFSNLRYSILPGANLVFCPNDGTDGGLAGLDPRNLWPGTDTQGRRVAQVVGADSYNAWPHVTTASAFAAKMSSTGPGGIPIGLESWRQWAAGVGAPFAVPEWSNNGAPGSAGGGGESPVFVQQFNAWARAHAGDVAAPRAGQLLYEVHFNMWTEYQFWPKSVQPRTATAYRSLTWGS